MGKSTKTLLATTTSLALLVACSGGGGGSSPSPTPTPSTTPSPTPTPTSSVASAGIDQVTAPGLTVTLAATGDSGATYAWTQTGGTTVSLSSTSVAGPTFTAPTLTANEVLTFEVAITAGGTTTTDTVTVEVYVAPDQADATLVGDFSDRQQWACAFSAGENDSSFTDIGSTWSISTNAIPSHAVGTFPNPGNPNTPTEQTKSWSIPDPTTATLANSTTDMQEFGVTLDGVKLERDTAESYNNAGQWRYEAITVGFAANTLNEWEWLGTDCNNAHVQPTGEYHYHGLGESYINMKGDDPNGDMILGGYAADGFPFYLRYGYTDPNNAGSGLKVMQGSWELIAGTRSSGPGGAYDGTFRNDWEYVDGSGDLDECNGRFGVTPEYPDGIYHYYLTDDYPFIPRCVSGTPDSSFRSMGGGR